MRSCKPNTENSVIQKISSIKLNTFNNNLFVKREDLIHNIISGNKWRKLKYNFKHCIDNNKSGILTFGGAFSNHLIATAEASRIFKIPCVGMVRGEELNEKSNHILNSCYQKGMKLEFIKRGDYKSLNNAIKLSDHKNHPENYKSELVLKKFREDFPQFINYHMIPEGGANTFGILGCTEIINLEKNIPLFDWIVLAQGTTTTSVGILKKLKEQEINSTKLLVVPALKGFDSIKEMSELLKRSNSADKSSGISDSLFLNKITRVADSYHFGGFSKTTPELLSFTEEITNELGFQIEPSYNAKALFALFDIVKKENWKNQNILYIHTGGYFQ